MLFILWKKKGNCDTNEKALADDLDVEKNPIAIFFMN